MARHVKADLTATTPLISNLSEIYDMRSGLSNNENSKMKSKQNNEKAATLI